MYEYIVIVLFILFFFVLYCNKEDEHFGSYQVDDFRNFAREYETQSETGNENNADLIEKYSWSEKNNLGETVYDMFYQDVTHNRIYGSDYEYAYRDIGTFADDGVYDTKFSTLSNNELSNFSIPDERIGTSITYNGEKVNLSQYEDNRQIPKSVFTNKQTLSNDIYDE